MTLQSRASQRRMSSVDSESTACERRNFAATRSGLGHQFSKFVDLDTQTMPQRAFRSQFVFQQILSFFERFLGQIRIAHQLSKHIFDGGFGQQWTILGKQKTVRNNPSDSRTIPAGRKR